MNLLTHLKVVGLILVFGFTVFGGLTNAIADTESAELFSTPGSGVLGYIPVSAVKTDSSGRPLQGISESDFDNVVQSIESVYTPIIQQMGGHLQIVSNWEDGTVNAVADREDGNWNLMLFGGLARAKSITKDGYLLAACGVLGYHIGGAPRAADGSEWYSNVSEADYFGALKCFRRVLQNTNSVQAMSHLNPPDSVLVACEKSFAPNENAAALCVRGAMAGYELAQVFADLAGEKSPDFSTPDAAVVEATNESYANSQCRLDTYLAGSLCPVSVTTDLSTTDPTVGACMMGQKNSVGYRPSCWYAPRSVAQESPWPSSTRHE